MRKWVWTPGGIIRLLFVIGFFVIGGVFQGENSNLSNICLILGGIVLVYSWYKTFKNIKSKNDGSEIQELINRLNDSWVSAEEKTSIRLLLKNKGINIETSK